MIRDERIKTRAVQDVNPLVCVAIVLHKRYPKYLSPSLSGLDSAIMLNHVGKILSNSVRRKQC